MATPHATALAELDVAQQRLSTLLLTEPRDQQAIAEAAELVRRLEIRALAVERREGGRR